MEARQVVVAARSELARAQQAGPYGGLAEALGCVRGGDTARLLGLIGYSSASVGGWELAVVSQLLKWLCQALGG